MEKKRFCAIIPAAGLGSRMGYLKPLLKIGGDTLILYLTALFLDAGADTVFIVLGYRGAEIEAAFNSIANENAGRVRFVYNSAYTDDMFISVMKGAKAALDAYGDTADLLGAFVIPADYPLLKRETVDMLARAAQNNRELVIYPVKDKLRGHPPFIPACTLRQIPGWERTGGLRAFLDTVPAMELDVTDAGILEDIDTPESYAAILRSRGLRTYPTPTEALRLLEDLNTDSRIIAHGRAVAELAIRIARLLSDNGQEIDSELAYTAGLLHDLGKGAENHAMAGFELLMAHAFPDAARVVRVHMDIDEESLRALCPESIVYLADKMTLGCRYVTLAERREHTRRKLSAPDAVAPGRKRIDNADVIYNAVCELCGLGHDELFRRVTHPCMCPLSP